jgi:hypothetical protein
LKKRSSVEVDDNMAFMSRIGLDRVHAALSALKDGKLSPENNEILEDLVMRILVEDLDWFKNDTAYD